MDIKLSEVEVEEDFSDEDIFEESNVSWEHFDKHVEELRGRLFD